MTLAQTDNSGWSCAAAVIVLIVCCAAYSIYNRRCEMKERTWEANEKRRKDRGAK
jgi:hypothetical protein